jgi:WD40 repeat protein
MWGKQCILQGRCPFLPCRGLALVPGIGFVSASHDMTLRVWDLTGTQLAILVGHQALVYSAAGAPDGLLIASASEDKTSRLWDIEGTLRQTLPHPGGYPLGPSYFCLSSPCLE